MPLPPGTDVTALMSGGSGGSIPAGTDVTALMNGSASRKAKPDLKTLEGLVATADAAGLGDEAREIAEPEKRLSLLQRLSAALGAFNPAEAIARTGIDGKGMPVPLEYLKTVGEGLASGITGNADYNEGRREFGDLIDSQVPRIAPQQGTMSNAIVQSAFGAPASAVEDIVRSGAGMVADIGLDPTTYLGGAMVQGAKKGLGLGVRAVEAVAPSLVGAGREAVKVMGDGVGHLFKYGHGTTPGVPEKALELQGELSKLKESVVDHQMSDEALSALPETDQVEAVRRLLTGKRLEQKLRARAERAETAANKALMEGADAEVSSRALGLENAADNLDDVSRVGRGVPATAARTLDNSLTGADVRLGTAHEMTTRVLDGQAKNAATRHAATQAAKKAGIETAMTGNAAERRALRQQLNQGGVPALPAQHAGLVDVIEHHARRVAGLRQSDPLTEPVRKQILRSREFARNAGIADPMAAYFPSLKNETTKIAAYLEGTAGMRQGAAGYRKQFKDLLKDEELVRNPAEAFARREFEMGKDAAIARTQQAIVRDHGRAYNAFKNPDEAAKAGYALIKEKGMFGKPVGWIKVEDKNFIDSLTVRGPIEKGIDDLARITGYDAVTSLFKRGVTGLFPAFHVRNYTSGHLQNFEVLGKDALNIDTIADGHRMALAMAKPEKAATMGTVRVGNKREIPLALALKPFEKRFGSSSQYIADIADATAGDGPSVVGKLFGETSLITKAAQKSKNPLSQEAIHFRAARAVGQFIETQQKATAYLTALRQGKSVQESLELATRAGFDYRALTSFESRVARRIMPFYSFTRKNAEMQLRVLGEHPERINQIMAVINNLGDRPGQDERAGLPEYIQGTFATKMSDTPSGKKQYMTGYGTAIEAFADSADTSRGFLMQKVGQMNPLLKVGIEQGVGVDAFRQKELKDVYNAEEYRDAPDFIKKMLNLRERQEPIKKQVNGKWKETGEFRTVYAADPRRLHIVRNLPTSRLVNTVSKLMDDDVSTGVKALTFFTGLKPQQIDIEAVARSTDKERRRDIQDLLTRYGVGYEMNRFIANKPKK